MDPVIVTIMVALAAIWAFVGKVIYDHLQGTPAEQPAAAAAVKVPAPAPAVVQQPAVAALEATENGDDSHVTRTKTGVPSWNLE